MNEKQMKQAKHRQVKIMFLRILCRHWPFNVAHVTQEAYLKCLSKFELIKIKR